MEYQIRWENDWREVAPSVYFDGVTYAAVDEGALPGDAGQGYFPTLAAALRWLSVAA